MQCISSCCLNNESMSKRLKKHIDLLKILKKANPQQRKILLQTCEKGLICCLCECIKNVLLGNVKISKSKHNVLAKDAVVLRKLADRKTNLDQKRNLLVQKGGFLPALLAPVLAITGGLISDLLVGQ